MNNSAIGSDEEIDMKSFPAMQKGDRTTHSGVKDGRVKSPRSQSYHFTEEQLLKYTRIALECNRPPSLSDRSLREIMRESWFSTMNPDLKSMKEE